MGKKSTKVSAPIRSYINRAIHRNEETKLSSNQYTLANFNGKIDSPGDLITLLPQVVAGTGQNNRIGSKIRPTRLEITGYVIYQAQNGNLNNDARMLGARLFCLQDKATRSYANAISNYNLLDLGGSSTEFQGTAMNWVSPHNKDQFIFYADRKMKVLKPYGYTNSSSPSSSVSITGMDSSMFHPFKIVLTQKQLPAVLTYDEVDSLAYPTNFSPVLALGYCDLLNNAADVTSTQLAMEFNATLYFKDA